MMNRSLLQRQMFANGGAALKPIPAGNQGLPNLPKEVRNNMGYMQDGGVAGLMQQPDMAAMPMEQPPMGAQPGMDPNLLMGALENAAETTGDLEQASDFESMMNQFSGGDKSEEERRTDLASIVGPEDASQTPDSVLALVTPVVQMAMVDEGIAPMAREAMDVPVQGDMAGGIMSMTGAGSEPPENFKLGGEVRRRGDEDPVQYFAPTNANRVAGKLTPMLRYEQDVGKTAESLLPVFQKFMPSKDPELAKRQLQSDILFDIANTALAFSAPMPGERPGMSAAERLAFATQQTKLLPTISARAAQSRKEQADAEQAARTGALTAAVGFEKERLAQAGRERLSSFETATKLLIQSKDLTAKGTAATTAFSRDKELKKLDNALTIQLEKIKNNINFASDVKLKNLANKIEKEQINLRDKLALNQINVKHEKAIDLFNKESVLKKDMQKITQVHEIAKLAIEIEFKEGIAASNNQTKLTIANENNNVKKYIANNRLDLDKTILKFNKLQETNKVNQLTIENNLNAKKFKLDELDLERKKLKDFLANERAKDKININQQSVNLAKKRLEELDQARLAFDKLKFLKGNALEKAKFEFEKLLGNHKINYDNNTLDIKRDINAINAYKNVLKNKELMFEQQANKLTKFGNSLDARTLAIISNTDTLEKYANGTLGDQEATNINALVTQYISPKTVYDEKTKSFKTITNKLPPEYETAAKARGAAGYTIPDLTGITKTPTSGDTTSSMTKALTATNFMNTGENVSLLDKNVPKLPLDRDKTGATGSGDYLLNALNLGFETLGLKQPFGEVSSAKKYLDSINVDLINVILADKTGKAAKDEREEIRRILPNMSAFVGGDETAAEKITGVIGFIDRKLETEILALKQLYQSKGDFTNSAKRVTRLKQLKMVYQSYLDAYNNQQQPAGTGGKTLGYYQKKVK